MKGEIIIIGAGGHGRVLADALQSGGTKVSGFIDADTAKWHTSVHGIPVLGGEEVLASWDPTSVLLANGVGSVKTLERRTEIFERFRKLGFRFATIVHPRAIVSSWGSLREGAQVLAGAIVQTDASVGENSIINTGSVIDHDCRIGAHCHIAPGCTLSGAVEVGVQSHIGSGATVIQGVKIGANALVAAGSVVVDSIADGCRVKGVPAREM